MKTEIFRFFASMLLVVVALSYFAQDEGKPDPSKVRRDRYGFSYEVKGGSERQVKEYDGEFYYVTPE